jgi:hypothetical protein
VESNDMILNLRILKEGYFDMVYYYEANAMNILDSSSNKISDYMRDFLMKILLKSNRKQIEQNLHIKFIEEATEGTTWRNTQIKVIIGSIVFFLLVGIFIDEKFRLFLHK